MGNKELFEKIAATYDSEERLKVNQEIIKAISGQLKQVVNKQVLVDFGCGTGEIGLAFVKDFEQVIFTDQSPNMLKVVEEKLVTLGFSNAETIDSNGSSLLDGMADCVIISQVLLHVKNTEELLQQLVKLLNNEGCLVIVDFDKNQQVVSDKIHNGFEQQVLASQLEALGLVNVVSEPFYQQDNLLMKKPASMFIMSGVNKFK